MDKGRIELDFDEAEALLREKVKAYEGLTKKELLDIGEDYEERIACKSGAIYLYSASAEIFDFGEGDCLYLCFTISPYGDMSHMPCHITADAELDLDIKVWNGEKLEVERVLDDGDDKSVKEAEGVDEDKIVVAELNARVLPIPRGEFYEWPLEELISKDGLGKVLGGGTQVGAGGEIDFIDIEIEMENQDEAAVTKLIKHLEDLDAPKGSKLIFHDEKEVEFGKSEGLAVYVNGTDLPAEVYQECDINYVIEEFGKLLEGVGKYYSPWEGPAETALYMYGSSFEEMKKRLSSFLETYPLLEKAKVVQIA